MDDMIKEVKPTTEIIQRPKCVISGCDNEALVLFAGKWICGDCASKKSDELNKRVWG